MEFANIQLGRSIVRRVRLRRGGGRDRACRVSEYVTLAQCIGILNAAERAEAAGEPFNVHKTINFGVLGIPDCIAAAATRRLIKLSSDWLASKGFRFRYGWVREGDLRDGNEGSHIHIVMHLPPELSAAFSRRWGSWKAKLAGAMIVQRRRGRSIKTTYIGGSLISYRSVPGHHADNLRNVLCYILKGALPETLDAVGIARLHKPGGRIVGKRAGWWIERRV